jgi:hypothetical protein
MDSGGNEHDDAERRSDVSSIPVIGKKERGKNREEKRRANVVSMNELATRLPVSTDEPLPPGGGIIKIRALSNRGFFSTATTRPASLFLAIN